MAFPKSPVSTAAIATCERPRRMVIGEPVFRLYPSMDAPQDGGEFNRRDILHIKALSYDGIVGMSPIQACAQAIGLGELTWSQSPLPIRSSAFGSDGSWLV